jgi:hypothetical protein
MSDRLTLRPLSCLLALLVALLPAQPLLGAEAEEEPQEGSLATSSLELTVRSAEGKPLEGVEVVMDRLRGDEPPVRGETGADGQLVMDGLVYGNYRLAFRYGDRAFPANRVLNLRPGREQEAEFTLEGFSPEDRRLGLEPGDPVPLLDEPAAGVAHLTEKTGPSGWAWLTTGKGVAVLVGGGALLVGGLIAVADDDEEDPLSPVEPE